MLLSVLFRHRYRPDDGAFKKSRVISPSPCVQFHHECSTEKGQSRPWALSDTRSEYMTAYPNYLHSFVNSILLYRAHEYGTRSGRNNKPVPLRDKFVASQLRFPLSYAAGPTTTCLVLLNFATTSAERPRVLVTSSGGVSASH